MQQFLMDGVEYNVHVTKLTREFSILEDEKTGRTQDEEIICFLKLCS